MKIRPGQRERPPILLLIETRSAGGDHSSTLLPEITRVAARRLRSHLRFGGTSIERGVRTVHVHGAPEWMWRDLFDAIERADTAKADSEITVRHDRP